MARLTFNDLTNIDRLAGLRTTNIGTDFIELEWNEISTADGYAIQPILPLHYPAYPSVRTDKTKYKLTNLVPGVHITIKVK